MDKEQLDKLEALARAATPGPWELNRHGAVLGGPIMHYSNGSGRNQIAMATGAEWQRAGEKDANATFIAAANPATVLALIAQARASQPEGATGTTGASIDTPEFRKMLCVVVAPPGWNERLIAHIDGIIADLRAQLAAKGQGERAGWFCETRHHDGSRTIFQVREGISGAFELYRAAPASAQPDRGAAQGIDVCAEMRALCSNCGGTGEVHRADGEYLGACDCMFQTIASPASQPVAPEAAHAHNPYAAPSWDHEAMPEECDDDVAHADDWISAVIRDVAELPDRDSPPDAPDMMLVTAEELREIVARHAPAAHADDLAWHKEALTAVRGKLAAVWDGIREAVQQYSGAPCEGEPFDRLDELLSRLSNAAHAQQEAAQAVCNHWSVATRLRFGFTCQLCAEERRTAAVAPSDTKDAARLHGFDRDDLEAIADGLEAGYEKSVDVGGSPFDGSGQNLIESTTSAAARFIRAAMAAAPSSEKGGDK